MDVSRPLRRRSERSRRTRAAVRRRPRGLVPVLAAIAFEYLERWAHQCQIRRALGLGSLADSPLLEIGHDIIATIAGAPSGDRAVSADDSDTSWIIGPIVLGARQQAADILTFGHTAAEVAVLVEGPDDAVHRFAARVGRR